MFYNPSSENQKCVHMLPIATWSGQWLSGKESACQAGDTVKSLSREGLLEKEMATRSSIHA